MVYVVQNSQNFSGLFPSSCIPKNTTFRKLFKYRVHTAYTDRLERILTMVYVVQNSQNFSGLRLALSKGPN
jgi:hypothetical protein